MRNADRWQKIAATPIGEIESNRRCLLPEVVLIHGWGVNRQIWQSLLPILSRFFRVTLLDIAGYAPNCHHLSTLSMETAVADLLNQAPAKATWVGWSLGGTLAIKAALADPHRIEQLILIGTTPQYLATDDWEWGMSQAALAELLGLFHKDYRKGMMRFLLMQTPDRQKVVDLVSAIENFHQPNWPTLVQTIKILTDSDLRTVIPQIKVPVASLIGTEDKIVSPQASAELQKLVSPNFCFEPLGELDGGDTEDKFSDSLPSVEVRNGSFFFPGGHLFFLDSPKLFVKALREIVGQRPS